MRRDLTPSEENYLEHILRLSKGGTARIREIARAAGVRLPSVTRAVSKLAAHGFVRHQAYGTVEITPEGIRAAEGVLRRDDCLMSLLVDVLDMGREQSKTEVCRLEHVLSLEVLARLEVLVQQATSPGSAAWLASLRRKLKSPRSKSTKTAKTAGIRVGSASLHAGNPLG